MGMETGMQQKASKPCICQPCLGHPLVICLVENIYGLAICFWEKDSRSYTILGAAVVCPDEVVEEWSEVMYEMEEPV